MWEQIASTCLLPPPKLFRGSVQVYRAIRPLFLSFAKQLCSFFGLQSFRRRVHRYLRQSLQPCRRRQRPRSLRGRCWMGVLTWNTSDAGRRRQEEKRRGYVSCTQLLIDEYSLLDSTSIQPLPLTPPGRALLVATAAFGQKVPLTGLSQASSLVAALSLFAIATCFFYFMYSHNTAFRMAFQQELCHG